MRKTFGLFREGGIFAELASSWGRHQRGASAVNLDGDVSLAGEEKRKFASASAAAKKEEKEQRKKEAAAENGEGRATLSSAAAGGGAAAGSSTSSGGKAQAGGQPSVDDDDDDEEEEDDTDMIQGSVAVKFLLAGGIAGAVSRTATAPFDRLKVYLITANKASAASEAISKGVAKGSTAATAKETAKVASKGVGLISGAIAALYREGGGLKAFWVGNGLNCIKIFPVSRRAFPFAPSLRVV